MTSRRTWAYILAGSMALHTPVMFPKQLEYASRPFRKAAMSLADGYEQYQIRNSRMFLVAKARDDARKGRLKLGEFILKANRIDALEEGRKLDFQKLRADYDRRVAALAKLEKERPGGVKEAVAEVFSDIDYYGKPGGKMADALIDKGGSCVQITHLLVSAVYDAGHKDGVFLRHYGANSAGISHVAPVISDNGRQYDLMAGAQAMTRKDGYYAGYKEPAADLIEDYAREHGIKAKGEAGVQKTGQGGVDGKAVGIDGRSTGFSGKTSTDVYGEGIPPLFSKQGIGKFNGREQMVASGQGKQAFDWGRYNRIPEQVLDDNKEERGYWPASEDPDTVRFNEPAFSESKLSLAFDGLAIVKERMLITNDRYEWLIDLGKISLMAAIAEYQARGLGRHKLAEWAIEERKRARESADKLFEDASRNRVEYSHALSRMNAEGKTSMAAIGSLGPKGQAMAKDAVERHVDKVSVAGILKVGERMASNNGSVLLERIETGHIGGPGAVVKLQFGNVIRKDKIGDGEKKTFFLAGGNEKEKTLSIKARVFSDSADIQICLGESSGSGNDVRNLAEILRSPSSRQGALEIAEHLDLAGQFELAMMMSDIELFPDSPFTKGQNAYARFKSAIGQGQHPPGYTFGTKDVNVPFETVISQAARKTAMFGAPDGWKDSMILSHVAIRVESIFKRPPSLASSEEIDYLRKAQSWLDKECHVNNAGYDDIWSKEKTKKRIDELLSGIPL